MSLTFSDFALADTIQQALTDLEFSAPTPVQAAAIPAALAGKDLLVSSQTGSGKTAAFLLPSLNPLAVNAQAPMSVRAKAIPSPQVLVLCPTRELAQQVSQDAIKLVRHVKGVRISSIMGGMPFGKQIAQLKGAQVVVATPGRLLDLVNRRQLSLDHVQTLILDEADRMLDLGFAEDLEAINDLASKREQTLMFSATFADRILKLAEKMTNDAERIAIQSEQTTNADIAQTLHWTDGFEHKKKLLTHWLNDTTLDQAVVFASTQEDTDMLAEELTEAGYQVVALHGAMPQAVRNRRIRSLREGRARVLVATDVAARGLDVPAISHVINFGLPMKNEDYVHRIGRTGRAGRSGQAITLATHRERSKIRSLEEYLQTRLPVSVIEGLEPSPPPEGARRNGRSYNNNGGRRRFEGERNFRDGGGNGGGRRFDRDGNRDGAPREGGYRGSRPEGDAPRSFRDSAPRDGGSYRERDGNREGGNFRERDGNRDYSSRPPRSDRFDRADRPEGDRRPRFADAPRTDRPEGERRPRFASDAPRGDRPNWQDRPARRPEGDSRPRFASDAPRGDRADRGGERRFDDRPRRDDSAVRSDRPQRRFEERERGDRRKRFED
jgi:superfamily II DNA/RNA helicase